jgi:hypothetical protein
MTDTKPLIKIIESGKGRHFIIDCPTCNFEVGDIEDASHVGGNERVRSSYSARQFAREDDAILTKHLFYLNIEATFAAFGASRDKKEIRLRCKKCNTLYYVPILDLVEASQKPYEK